MRTLAARISVFPFLAAGLLLLAAAGYVLSTHLITGGGWQRTTATVTSTSVAQDHDASGHLVFRLEVSFQFSTPSGPQISTGKSGYATNHFHSIVKFGHQYDRGTSHDIYYLKSDPTQLRFDSGLTWLNVRYPLVISALAAMMFAVALIIFTLSGRRRECPECGTPGKSYYKFCPHCAAIVDSHTPRTAPADSAPEASLEPDRSAS